MVIISDGPSPAQLTGLLRGSEETMVVEMPGRPRHPVPTEMMTATVGLTVACLGACAVPRDRLLRAKVTSISGDSPLGPKIATHVVSGALTGQPGTKQVLLRGLVS